MLCFGCMGRAVRGVVFSLLFPLEFSRPAPKHESLPVRGTNVIPGCPLFSLLIKFLDPPPSPGSPVPTQCLNPPRLTPNRIFHFLPYLLGKSFIFFYPPPHLPSEN